MSLGWSRYGCRRSGCRRTDVAATLKARVAELEAGLAQAKERSRGHRADFEGERAHRPATRGAELFPPYSYLSSRRGPRICPWGPLWILPPFPRGGVTFCGRM